MKKGLVAVTLLLGACAALLCVRPSALCVTLEDINYYVDRGNNCLVRGEVDNAIKEFNEAIKLIESSKANSRFATVYYNRGVAYEFKNDLTQAIEDYGAALLLNPRYIAVYFRRGDLLQKIGRLDDALSDYKDVIAIAPFQPHAYNNCGLVYQRKGEYDQAIAEFEKALEKDPKLMNVHYNLGVSYLNKKDYFQAYSDFSKELEINPSSYNAKHYYRAVFSFYHKEYEKSWEAVHKLQAGGYTVSLVFLEDLKKVLPEEQVKGSADKEESIIKSGWEEEDKGGDRDFY